MTPEATETARASTGRDAPRQPGHIHVPQGGVESGRFGGGTFVEQRRSHCIQTAQINNTTLLATRLPTRRIEAARARVGGFPFELVVSQPAAKDRCQSTGRSCREESDFTGEICRGPLSTSRQVGVWMFQLRFSSASMKSTNVLTSVRWLKPPCSLRCLRRSCPAGSSALG